MGYPLLEAVIEYIQSTFADNANNGACFFYLESKLDDLLCFLDSEIKNGKDEIAGKKLIAIFQDNDSNFFHY